MIKKQLWAKEAAKRTLNPVESPFELGFLEGFDLAITLAAKLLGPPWRFASLNVTRGEIFWDQGGIIALKNSIKTIGNDEVK